MKLGELEHLVRRFVRKEDIGKIANSYASHQQESEKITNRMGENIPRPHI